MFVVPLDEVVQEVLDPLLHLGLLQRDRIALVGDLHHQLAQLVQLALDLEEALGRQGEPERRKTRLCDSSENISGKSIRNDQSRETVNRASHLFHGSFFIM